MKKKISVILLCTFLLTLTLATVADARVRVRGYFRKSGKYVYSYYRKSPHKRY